MAISMNYLMRKGPHQDTGLFSARLVVYNDLPWFKILCHHQLKKVICR